jgi:hypothetical protein
LLPRDGPPLPGLQRAMMPGPPPASMITLLPLLVVWKWPAVSTPRGNAWPTGVARMSVTIVRFSFLTCACARSHMMPSGPPPVGPLWSQAGWLAVATSS